MYYIINFINAVNQDIDYLIYIISVVFQIVFFIKFCSNIFPSKKHDKKIKWIYGILVTVIIMILNYNIANNIYNQRLGIWIIRVLGMIIYIGYASIFCNTNIVHKSIAFFTYYLIMSNIRSIISISVDYFNKLGLPRSTFFYAAEIFLWLICGYIIFFLLLAKIMNDSLLHNKHWFKLSKGDSFVSLSCCVIAYVFFISYNDPIVVFTISTLVIWLVVHLAVKNHQYNKSEARNDVRIGVLRAKCAKKGFDLPEITEEQEQCIRKSDYVGLEEQIKLEEEKEKK